MKIIFVLPKARYSLRVLVFLFFAIPFAVFSQIMNDFGFERGNPLNIRRADTSVYQYPWAGGMNSCQFSVIDMDMDGDKDLFVFDRIGHRIIPFLRDESSGNPIWTFAPQYIGKFPLLADWVRLRDYNCDGKEDIFTYGYGGITVYKNISTPSTGLQFEFKVMHVLSFQFLTYQSLYASSVDYPAIEDLDGDGDLDILNFWIVGTYINYHRNMSMEKFGHCDSLDYKLEEFCWGNVKEGATSNSISLNAVCPFVMCPALPSTLSDELLPAKDRAIEHTGSTLTSLDLNGDGILELLLGDVDFPGIIALHNGGTSDSAHIISVDEQFPSNDIPVEIASFPACDYVDVDFDGKRDLLVSPFDPSYNISRNTESAWLYKNTGTDAFPVFSKQQEDFFQKEMLEAGSGSMPVLADIDMDGLSDLVVGDYGFYDSSYYSSGFLYSVYHSRLLYFRNTGTAAAPDFRLADQDLGGLGALNLYNACPAFGDLDDDGDADMLVGNSDGKLYYLRNDGSPGQAPSYAAPQGFYGGIDVGGNSTPQLFDLDKDGLLDLLIGNTRGLIHYFRNTGTASLASFSLVADSLGGVDMRDLSLSYDGYSIPCFFREASGITRLFCGSLKGGIAYYRDIDGNLNGIFELVDKNYLYLKDGEHSAPAVGHLSSDTLPELIMGNASGGLAWYNGISPLPAAVQDYSKQMPAFRIYPNPGQGVFHLCWEGIPPAETVSLRIMDIKGREVRKFTLVAGAYCTLDLSALSPGIYLAEAGHMANQALPARQKFIICR